MTRRSTADLACMDFRDEGILILSGGLTIHSFEDVSAFAEPTAKPIFKEFDQTLLHAVTDSSVCVNACLPDIRYFNDILSDPESEDEPCQCD